MSITGKALRVRFQKTLTARLCPLGTLAVVGSALMPVQSGDAEDDDGDSSDDLLCTRHCPLPFAHVH